MVPMVASAGLLLFRRVADGGLEVLLGHMGGPYWAGKDDAGWSMPKGEHDPDEPPLTAARREFAEEMGAPAPAVDYLPLGSVRASGKTITAWAGEADFDAAAAVSGTFELEWPPRSGRVQRFPEIDRAQWFDLAAAAVKLVKGQRPFLERLSAAVAQLPG